MAMKENSGLWLWQIYGRFKTVAYGYEGTPAL